VNPTGVTKGRRPRSGRSWAQYSSPPWSPGSVVLLVPYLLSGWRFAPPILGLSATRWLGAGLFLIAVPFFGEFLARFVREGRGTPAPIAPTERLVTGGVFRHVRNPGYLSVLAMLAGQGLFFGSVRILLYAVLVGVGFHLFVVFYEEPTLRARFGAEYEDYCRRVPRWIPQLTPKV
jgi:protein-S-isoprenylcysteine O-methyltransferase Ste14